MSIVSRYMPGPGIYTREEINARSIKTMIGSRQDAPSTSHYLARYRVAWRTRSFLHRTPCCKRGKPHFGEKEVNRVACTDWDGNMDPDRIQGVEVALVAERG